MVQCMYSKICTHCGKPFVTEKEWIKLCSHECYCEIRKRCAQEREYNKKKITQPETVTIKISEPLDVFDDMRPEVGSVHTAEKVQNGEQYLYIIRGIGKYGLIVRANECVEVN